MPRVEYEIALSAAGDRLRVRIMTERGHVVDFVVQYEAFIADAYRPIVRHDASHGQAHRGVFSWNGDTVRKDWARPGITLGEALDEAINDLSESWARELGAFIRRRP